MFNISREGKAIVHIVVGMYEEQGLFTSLSLPMSEFKTCFVLICVYLFVHIPNAQQRPLWGQQAELHVQICDWLWLSLTCSNCTYHQHAWSCSKKWWRFIPYRFKKLYTYAMPKDFFKFHTNYSLSSCVLGPSWISDFTANSCWLNTVNPSC